MAVCACLAGFFLYIKRRNEKSGEFFGFSWVNTLLKYYTSLCVAMFTYLAVKSVLADDGGLAPFVMGIIFGVLMFVILRGIFEKSFKAMFSKPKLIAIYLVVTVFLLCSAEFDIFGLDKRVGNIETVRISAFDTDIYDKNNNEFLITLNSPECIEAVYELTGAMVSDGPGATIVEMNINENPFGFDRRFEVPVEVYNNFVSVIYNSEDYKEDYVSFLEKRLKDTTRWEINNAVDVYNINDETRALLYKALSEDIRGCSYDDVEDSVVVFGIGFDSVDGYHYFGCIPVYSCFEKTVSFINDLIG